MSILTRFRSGARNRVVPPAGGDIVTDPTSVGEPDARTPVWPLLVLVAGAVLSGLWVLGLLWGAFVGMAWLVAPG